MAKPRKYKPLKDLLSIDTTLVQASALLDIAAAKAIEDGDINNMKKVARGWLELGSVMHQLGQVAEEEELEEHEVLSKTTIGFQGVYEEVDEEDEFVEEEEPEFKGTKFQIGFRANE